MPTTARSPTHPSGDNREAPATAARTQNHRTRSIAAASAAAPATAPAAATAAAPATAPTTAAATTALAPPPPPPPPPARNGGIPTPPPIPPTPVATLPAAGSPSTFPPQKSYLILERSEDLAELLAGNKVVVLIFSAQWCGPCKLISTALEELGNKFKEKAILIKIDVDDFEDVALEYKISMMPTILMLKDNKELKQIIGGHMDKLEKELDKYCNRPQK